MKISNDLNKLDSELGDASNKPKKGVKQTSKFGSLNNTPNKQPKKPKDNKKKVTLIGVAIAAVVLGGIWGLSNHKSKSTAQKPKEEHVQKKKSVDPKKEAQRQAELAKQQSDAEKIQAEKDKKAAQALEKNKEKTKKGEKFKDGKPAIKALFTTMDVYEDAKESQYQIATKMLKYANRDVVNTLMPGALQSKKKQNSFNTIGKFYKPLLIEKDPAGNQGVYNVGVWRSVTAGSHTSKYNDSFVVTTDKDGKVVNVNPRTSTID